MINPKTPLEKILVGIVAVLSLVLGIILLERGSDLGLLGILIAIIMAALLLNDSNFQNKITSYPPEHLGYRNWETLGRLRGARIEHTHEPRPLPNTGDPFKDLEIQGDREQTTLDIAAGFIRLGQFEDARIELLKIPNNPKAQEWLKKLENQPQK